MATMDAAPTLLVCRLVLGLESGDTVGVKVRLMVRVWGYGVRLGCGVRVWR